MIGYPYLSLPLEVTGMQELEPSQTWRAQTIIRMTMDDKQE